MRKKQVITQPATRNVVVCVRGFRTVQSVGKVVLQVPAAMSDDEVLERLEDTHDLLPTPEEWEDLDDDAEIEVNLGIQPFGVCAAPWDEQAQASFFAEDE